MVRAESLPQRGAGRDAWSIDRHARRRQWPVVGVRARARAATHPFERVRSNRAPMRPSPDRQHLWSACATASVSLPDRPASRPQAPALRRAKARPSSWCRAPRSMPALLAENWWRAALRRTGLPPISSSRPTSTRRSPRRSDGSDGSTAPSRSSVGAAGGSATDRSTSSLGGLGTDARDQPAQPGTHLSCGRPADARPGAEQFGHARIDPPDGQCHGNRPRA